MSREVPLSLVYLFIAQLVGAAVVVLGYGQELQSARTDHEKRISAMESQRLTERIVSLEQQMVDAKRVLEKIDGKVDRLLERKAP